MRTGSPTTSAISGSSLCRPYRGCGCGGCPPSHGSRRRLFSIALRAQKRKPGLLSKGTNVRFASQTCNRRNVETQGPLPFWGERVPLPETGEGLLRHFRNRRMPNPVSLFFGNGSPFQRGKKPPSSSCMLVPLLALSIQETRRVLPFQAFPVCSPMKVPPKPSLLGFDVPVESRRCGPKERRPPKAKAANAL